MALTPPDSPDRPGVLNNLGNGLRDRYGRTGRLEDLEAAIEAFQRALATLDRAFLLSPVAYQLGQQARWAGLAAGAVAVHRQAGRNGEALAIAEGSKSRLLAALLGRGRLPVPAAIPADLAAREQALAEELADLDAADLARHGQGGGESTLPRRQALLGQLMAIWEQMAGYGPEAAAYVALRRAERPTRDDLARLAAGLGPQTAALSLFDTGEQVLLFVLRAPEASAASDGWQPIVVEAAIPPDELRHVYLANYLDEVLERRAHRAVGRPLTHRWRALGEPLLAPALPHLAGVERLVLVPEGPFHLLPLHALRLNGAGETLLDRFAVSYIPALSLLDRLWRRPPPAGDGALVLGYSADPSTARGSLERAIFLGEAEAVAQQMGVAPLLDDAASAANLRAALDGREVHLVHLSCHGYFDPQDALRSGVLLRDGVFAAREWMALRFRAGLVTLSACQTGLARSLGEDEMAGLSQALLYAGASSLLVGRWSVEATTTAALMVAFYRRLWDSAGNPRTDKATALREAALALRDGDLPTPSGIDPTDPYYWAPFVLVGDWR